MRQGSRCVLDLMVAVSAGTALGACACTSGASNMRVLAAPHRLAASVSTSTFPAPHSHTTTSHGLSTNVQPSAAANSSAGSPTQRPKSHSRLRRPNPLPTLSTSVPSPSPAQHASNHQTSSPSLSGHAQLAALSNLPHTATYAPQDVPAQYQQICRKTKAIRQRTAANPTTIPQTSPGNPVTPWPLTAQTNSGLAYTQTPRGRNTPQSADSRSVPGSKQDKTEAAPLLPEPPKFPWRPYTQLGLQLPAALRTLPGMTGPPASDQELLQAVAKIPRHEYPTVADALQKLLAASSTDGPTHTFVFDTETTSRSPAHERAFWSLPGLLFRPVDLCMVHAKTGDMFNTLVNPGGRGIHPDSQQVHHISMADVRYSPNTSVVSLALMLWIWQRCEAVGGAQAVLLAHNARFDLQVLSHSLADVGMTLPLGWVGADSLQLSHRLWPGSTGHKLPDFAGRLGLTPGPHQHRARPDVELLVAALNTTTSFLDPQMTLDQAVHVNFHLSGDKALPVTKDRVDAARTGRLTSYWDVRPTAVGQPHDHELAVAALQRAEATRLWAVGRAQLMGVSVPCEQMQKRSLPTPDWFVAKGKDKDKARPADKLGTSARSTKKKTAACSDSECHDSTSSAQCVGSLDTSPVLRGFHQRLREHLQSRRHTAEGQGAQLHTAEPVVGSGVAYHTTGGKPVAHSPTCHHTPPVPHGTPPVSQHTAPVLQHPPSANPLKPLHARRHTSNGKPHENLGPSPVHSADSHATTGDDHQGNLSIGSTRAHTPVSALFGAPESALTAGVGRVRFSSLDAAEQHAFSAPQQEALANVGRVRFDHDALQLQPSSTSPASSDATSLDTLQADTVLQSVTTDLLSPSLNTAQADTVLQSVTSQLLSNTEAAVVQPKPQLGAIRSADMGALNHVVSLGTRKRAVRKPRTGVIANSVAPYATSATQELSEPEEDRQRHSTASGSLVVNTEKTAAATSAQQDDAVKESAHSMHEAVLRRLSTLQPPGAAMSSSGSEAAGAGRGAVRRERTVAKARRAVEDVVAPAPVTAARKKRRSVSREVSSGPEPWSLISGPLTKGNHITTDIMVEKLKKAGFHSLLDLLMHFPRKYRVLHHSIQPGLEEQGVALPVTFKTVYAPKALAAKMGGLLKAQLEVVGTGQSLTLTEYGFGYMAVAQLATRRAEFLSIQEPRTLLGTLQVGTRSSLEVKDCHLVAPGDAGTWVRQLLGLETTLEPAMDTGLPSDPDVSLLPVYKARTPLTAKDFLHPEAKLKGLMERALRTLEDVPGAASGLAGVPSKMMPQLLPWHTAIKAVHAPRSEAHRDLARKSLAYHELVFLQLRLLMRRVAFVQANAGKQMCLPVPHSPILDAAVAALPFKLTADQKRVSKELLKDMGQALPMLRLLQGDVGSGKTVVAMKAMMATAATGAQALLLAPTEILAQQHHRTLTEWVENLPLVHRKPLMGTGRAKPLLLSGSTKASDKKDIVARIKSGEARLVVSTHAAFFTEDWHKLGLVVIDEQHKFGLAQKKRLLELCPSVHPHVLSMSATPIPRTMALAIYGDMEISIIQGRPPGRKQVATQTLVDDDQGFQSMVKAVIKEVETGGRAFMVYPGVGTGLSDTETDSDDEDSGGKKKSKRAAKGKGKTASKGKKTTKASAKGRKKKSVEESEEEQDEAILAEEEVEAIKTCTEDFDRMTRDKTFGKHKCVLLHGGMKPEDKEKAIAQHRAGTHPIMICTSVVEVGVDVPEASIMVVQQADRFGLAQLHQMRGRVGRSSRPSKCLLMTKTGSEEALMRLQTLETCHDGLEIAEKDLVFRGAGALFNSTAKQSGTPDCSRLCSEELLKDPQIILAAREAATGAHKKGLTPALEAALEAFTRLGMGPQANASAVEEAGATPMGQAH